MQFPSLFLRNGIYCCQGNGQQQVAKRRQKEICKIKAEIQLSPSLHLLLIRAALCHYA